MQPAPSALQLTWSPPATAIIAILGVPRLTIHDHELPLRSGGKSETLLCQMALTHRKPVDRTTLLTALWPHEALDVAGNALNTLTSDLNKKSRKVLHTHQSNGNQSGSANLICHDQGSYRFNVEAGVGTDVEYFDRWYGEGLRRLRAGDTVSGVAYCQKALALYRGDIGGDSLTALLERERLRAARLDLLTALADYYVEQADWSGALEYLHYLLKIEPCREDAHRQIMRCHVKLGRRDQALRQFQLCTHILQHEFAAPPEPATVALFDQVRLDPGSIV
ncbi:MAG: bacterial transcriptional activator domain-containing protein [Caldilineaceae bacterium]|nr:bacterial transcriptional activator domain-containing protein [Caldilineaceae bacterium]MCB0128018.1 bacterial transcriptional activator domain-containing protein [Caldilineaceae bacterium]